MGNTVVNGVTLTNPLVTMFALRGKDVDTVSSGGVTTRTPADPAPNTKMFVLAKISSSEASTLGGLLTVGASLTVVSDSYGTVTGIVDQFSADINGAYGFGVGRILFH